jgi:hypothetical protein
MDRSFTQYDRFLRLIGGYMNFRKLLTCLTVSTAAVIPFASAQNPTILQGSYISNVFGNSNFVKNPNAQTNVANVTTVTATVARSTTTPLVATSEFTVAIGTANGTATWATRAFDAGMKNQNCEARFTYRGFQATSKVQIKQSTNVVAELVLTPSATDPRIASINFPCGDLSAATTFVVTDTAILAGTNEIGGIYVGLATNMANVAQAEFVGSLTWPATSGNSQVINQTAYTVFSNLGTTPTAAGNVTASGTAVKVTIPNMKAGSYQIIFTGNAFCFSLLMDISCNYRITDGTTAFGQEIGQRSIGYVTGGSIQGQTQTSLIFSFDYSGPVTSKTFQLEGKLSNANGEIRIETAAAYGNYKVAVYRFPSSSELVVTPERQNTWGAVEYRNSQQTLFSGSAEPTGYSSFNNATWNQPTLLKGKAAVTTTNSGNDLGFSIPNLPVGSYKLEISGYIYSQAGAVVDDNTVCTFKIQETTTSTTVGEQVTQGGRPTANTNTSNAFLSFQGIYTNTAIATRNFRLEANKTYDSSTTNAGSCRADSYAAGGTTSNIISFTITPLDQPSNSALYVQGPVKAAETGAAIPAGYVGEKLEENTNANGGSNTIAVNTGTNIRVLTIPPGVWLVCSGIGYDTSASTSPARVISTLSKTSATNGTSGINRVDSVSLTIGQTAHTPPCAYENNSSNVTYYLTGYNGATSGTINITGAFIRAIRLN